jgi:hypothetical protein
LGREILSAPVSNQVSGFGSCHPAGRESPRGAILTAPAGRPDTRKEGPHHAPTRGHLEASVNTLLSTFDVLFDDLAEQAWNVYTACLTKLVGNAVQRQMMTPAEFKEQMSDPRIEKMLLRDEAGTVIGLATNTNQLDAVHLIDPAYFQRRWPDAYAAGHIWYVPFVAVADNNYGAYHTIVEHMFNRATRVNGQVWMDVCDYNVQQRRFIRSIDFATRRLARAAGHPARMLHADNQGYYGFDVNAAHFAGTTR